MNIHSTVQTRPTKKRSQKKAEQSCLSFFLTKARCKILTGCILTALQFKPRHTKPFQAWLTSPVPSVDRLVSTSSQEPQQQPNHLPKGSCYEIKMQSHFALIIIISSPIPYQLAHLQNVDETNATIK